MAETTITITVECPDCEEEFQADTEMAGLAEDQEDGIGFECPECGCEFDHAYTYDATTGAFELGELLEIEDEDTEETEDPGDED